MTEAQSTTGGSRLPWLENEGEPAGNFRAREIAGWLVAGALVVFGGAYWVTTHNSGEQAPQQVTSPTTTTAVLPQTENNAPPAKAKTPKMSAVGPQRVARPVRHPTIAVRHSAPAPVSKPSVAAAKPAPAPQPAQPASTAPSLKAPAQVRTASRSAPPAAKAHVPVHEAPVFPIGANAGARTVAGLPQPGPFTSPFSGRLVQLGAFGSLDRSKLAWRTMEQAYPPLKRFHAGIIQNRDWNGHAFYQFQVATASQADSEMLCQTMERRNFRCTVVRAR